jgi:hypothetical protein
MPVTNMRAFRTGLTAARRKVLLAQDKRFQELVRFIFEGIVNRTPVDYRWPNELPPYDKEKKEPHPGQAKGGWRITTTSRVASVKEGKKSWDPTGEMTLARGRKTINKAKLGQKITIYNRVEYISLLESGAGSQQAPYGMANLTLAEAYTFFKDIIG